MAIKEIIYTANIIESERGWGKGLVDTQEFKTEEKRDKFIEDFNRKSMPPLKFGQSTPDWYEYAERGEDIIRNPKPRRKKK